MNSLREAFERLQIFRLCLVGFLYFNERFEAWDIF